MTTENKDQQEKTLDILRLAAVVKFMCWDMSHSRY